MTRPHQIIANTTIDGGNVITLEGGGFFGSDGVTFRIENLRIHGASQSLGSAIASTGMNVVIYRSRIEDSIDPVIVTRGSLRVEQSEFMNNQGTAIGAIANVTDIVSGSQFRNTGVPLFTDASVVTISDSTISDSAATVFHKQVSPSCQLTVLRSRFSNNHNPSDFAPGGALNTDCDSTIVDTEFLNNVGSSGGAINIGHEVSRVTLRSVKMTQNSAAHAGGAIALEASTSPDRKLEIIYGSFIGNSANVGGAIDLGNNASSARVTLVGNAVTFSKNSASVDGGAVHRRSAAVEIFRGVFVNNEANGFGGAIDVRNLSPRPMVLANALLARNRAGTAGSAVYAVGVSFINSTIADNAGVAVSGFGLFGLVNPPLTGWRAIHFSNSIISNNELGNCAKVSNLEAIEYADDGHNLQFPNSDCVASIPVANPYLDTMYIPSVGSSALNGGDNNVCAASPINGRDVYGQGRPQLKACTIGAVEGDIQHLLRGRHIPLLGGSPGKPGAGSSQGEGTTSSGSNCPCPSPGAGSGKPGGGSSQEPPSWKGQGKPAARDYSTPPGRSY